MTQSHPATSQGHVEEVELNGHIIDSLLLPKVLDEILTRGGTFVLKEVKIGERQGEQHCGPSGTGEEAQTPASPFL